MLPFENNGDAASGRIADAITGDIITDLSRYSDFTVLAQNTAAAYQGKPVNVRQIRKELGARFVLAGTYQKEDGTVRVTAHLIDAITATNVWSERYDRPAADVFAVQSEVADKVANSLGGAEGLVPQHAAVAARRKPPGDLGAYELYLVGRETMKTGLTIDNLLKAKELLERAIAIDPTLARAYVILAWTYAWRVNVEPDRSRLIGEMIEVARRAVELDPMDAEAHQAFGYALGLQGDNKQAEIQFDESLRLNPNAFDILTVYACWASVFGKAQSGVDAVDRAMRLNPNYPPWSVACFRAAFFQAGKYAEVVNNQARLPEDKWNIDDYVHVAGSLAELGQTKDAEGVVARGIAKFPAMLSIEAFALNRTRTEPERVRTIEAMRKAKFPLCASDQDLAGIANPIRLPECVTSQQ